MPYIGTRVLGSKFVIGVQQGVLQHENSYGIRNLEQERLLVQEGFVWLCIKVLIRQDF